MKCWMDGCISFEHQIKDGVKRKGGHVVMKRQLEGCISFEHQIKDGVKKKGGTL